MRDAIRGVPSDDLRTAKDLLKTVGFLAVAFTVKIFTFSSRVGLELKPSSLLELSLFLFSCWFVFLFSVS